MLASNITTTLNKHGNIGGWQTWPEAKLYWQCHQRKCHWQQQCLYLPWLLGQHDNKIVSMYCPAAQGETESMATIALTIFHWNYGLNPMAMIIWQSYVLKNYVSLDCVFLIQPLNCKPRWRSSMACTLLYTLLLKFYLIIKEFVQK